MNASDAHNNGRRDESRFQREIPFLEFIPGALPQAYIEVAPSALKTDTVPSLREKPTLLLELVLVHKDT